MPPRPKRGRVPRRSVRLRAERAEADARIWRTRTDAGDVAMQKLSRELAAAQKLLADYRTTKWPHCDVCDGPCRDVSADCTRRASTAADSAEQPADMEEQDSPPFTPAAREFRRVNRHATVATEVARLEEKCAIHAAIAAKNSGHRASEPTGRSEVMGSDKKGTTMNLDLMTVGEVKQLCALVDGKRKPVKSHSIEVGKSYFIRTVTMHYTGRVVAVTASDIVLEDAAWIADSGRFYDALTKGSLNEVEPFPGKVVVGRGGFVDAAPWDHELPRKQK